MRLAHSRFYKSKPVRKGELFDRVVTTAWDFDPEKSVLTYAATVFKKKDSKDHWYRKQHVQETIKRFNTKPVRVVLKSKKHIPELSNICMDWYISQNLIFKFGSYNDNPVDVRRIHGNATITRDFNILYNSLAYKYSQHGETTESYEEKRSSSLLFLMVYLGSLYSLYQFCLSYQ